MEVANIQVKVVEVQRDTTKIKYTEWKLHLPSKSTNRDEKGHYPETCEEKEKLEKELKEAKERVIKEYKESEQVTDDIADESLGVFFKGFAYYKKKVKEVILDFNIDLLISSIDMQMEMGNSSIQRHCKGSCVHLYWCQQRASSDIFRTSSYQQDIQRIY